MDRRDQRPPRSAPPPGNPSAARSPPAYYDEPQMQRPSPNPMPGGRHNVSFQDTELGDRHAHLESSRERFRTAYRDNSLPPTPDDAVLEGGAGSGFEPSRKKSLVRPDREKIGPGHRLWHYRTHAQQLEEEGGRVGLMPSCMFALLARYIHKI